MEGNGTRGLNHIKAQRLKAMTKRITQTVLCISSTRIVATTLSGSALDVLRLAFKPTALVGDESGQSLEGDHMIAMTMESIKSVCLFGDPSQLPLTVISQPENNEGSAYLQRSLIHTAIFDIINQHVYGKTLSPGPYNDLPERVGNTWDDFTKSRHYFFNQGLAGVRRLMISVIGKSTEVPGGTSPINRANVNVAADLLSELYKFRTDGGDYIEAEDVMIISPYKGQRDLVKTVFDERQIGFQQNLTVDACQGQEAPIVIFLMTKPSDNPKSLGFFGDAKRLNVAMSRAQKLMIIVGNLEIWDEDVARWMSKTGTAPFLSNILFDCVKKGHVLTWRGNSTVEKPGATAIVYGGHAETHWPGTCMVKAYPPVPMYHQFDEMDVDAEGNQTALQSHEMDIDGEKVIEDDTFPHPISTPRAPEHNRMERRSLSLRGHPTAVRHQSRSPMQQDSKGDGNPLVGKSRAELVQSLREKKALAESLGALARGVRCEQWAIEREISDLDKMEYEEYYN
ncbi:hypothetical protein N7486_000386 [Penicillium sp. IBT 16267x]|nr:hypothetical protein N7486_000386 [Penicillium sp. IBT 16267x]